MFSRLSPRERDLLLITSAVIILFLLIRFIFFPAFDRRKALTNQLQAQKNTLKQMTELERRYAEIQVSATAKKEKVMKRDRSFTLFSFLDTLAQESSVKENVIYMKPSTRKSESSELDISNVKVKLDGIAIKQAEEFIYKIETSDNMVYIRSISLSRSGEERKLSAIIEAETIMQTGS